MKKTKRPRRLFRKPDHDRTQPIGPPGFIRGLRWDIYREAADWKVYMNPSMGMFHIKESLIDSFRRWAAGHPELEKLGSMDWMLEIAALASGHLARLVVLIRSGSEVAASEGKAVGPVETTFHVIMQEDRSLFVTDDEPLYW